MSTHEPREFETNISPPFCTTLKESCDPPEEKKELCHQYLTAKQQFSIYVSDVSVTSTTSTPQLIIQKKTDSKYPQRKSLYAENNINNSTQQRVNNKDDSIPSSIYETIVDNASSSSFNVNPTNFGVDSPDLFAYGNHDARPEDHPSSIFSTTAHSSAASTVPDDRSSTQNEGSTNLNFATNHDLLYQSSRFSVTSDQKDDDDDFIISPQTATSHKSPESTDISQVSQKSTSRTLLTPSPPTTSSSVEFTQGTTDLAGNLIVSIPDKQYLSAHQSVVDSVLNKPSLNLQELVIGISYLLQNGRYHCDLRKVETIMKRYDPVANNLDYTTFMHVDPSVQYTRNLIATDNKNWTLLLLCFNPHSQSPIHNHPNCECYVRVLKNTVNEFRYAHPISSFNSNAMITDGKPAQSSNNKDENISKSPTTSQPEIIAQSIEVNDMPRFDVATGKVISTPEQPKKKCGTCSKCLAAVKLVQTSQSACHEGDVTFMNDNLGLHKLQNPTNELSITLHLYFPPYSSCKIYLNESMVATISNICYHSMYGKPQEL